MREPRIRLGPNQTAVVGYGSLMSLRSVSRTLNRRYEGPFVDCALESWRRSWDVAMPNEAYYFETGEKRIYPEKILYLNVRRQPGDPLNCKLLVLGETDIATLHAREWIYRPTVVTGQLRGIRLEGGDAIVYTGREEHRVGQVDSPREAAVRASYLRLLDRVLHEQGAGFREQYERTTDAMPRHLVIADKLDPERPSPWAWDCR